MDNRPSGKTVKTLFRVGQVIVVVAAAVSLVYFFIRHSEEIRKALEAARPWALIASILFYALSFLLLSALWYLLLARRAPWLHSLMQYSTSQLVRYLPGGVWVYGARVLAFRRFGIGTRSLTVLMLFESAFQILSGAVFSIFVLERFHVPPGLLFALLVVAIILVTSLPDLLKRFLRVRLSGLEGRAVSSRTTWVRFLSGYGLFWIFSGTGTFAVANAVTDVAITELPMFIAIFAIAWILGFLSVISPSGIGVRELVLTLLLQPYVGLPVAGLIAILSRILFTAGELLVFLPIALLYAGRKRTSENVPYGIQ